MNGPAREMTLLEWVERLPDNHFARKEYSILKSLISKQQSTIEKLTKALEGVINSEALKEAPFYNYSEAVLNAKEALAELKEEE